MAQPNTTPVSPMFVIKNPDEELKSVIDQLKKSTEKEKNDNQVLFDSEDVNLQNADVNRKWLESNYDQFFNKVSSLNKLSAEITVLSLGTKTVSDLLAGALSNSTAMMDSANTLSKNINQTSGSLTSLSNSLGTVFSELSSGKESESGIATVIQDELKKAKAQVAKLETDTLNAIKNAATLSQNAWLVMVQDKIKLAVANVDALNAGVGASVKDLQGNVTASLAAFMDSITKNNTSDANYRKYSIDLVAAKGLNTFLQKYQIPQISTDKKNDELKKKGPDAKQIELDELQKNLDADTKDLQPLQNAYNIVLQAFNLADGDFKIALKTSVDAKNNQELFEEAQSSLSDVKKIVDTLNSKATQIVNKLHKNASAVEKTATKNKDATPEEIDGQSFIYTIKRVEDILTQVNKISGLITQITDGWKADNTTPADSLLNAVLLAKQLVNTVIGDTINLLSPSFDIYKTSLKYKEGLSKTQDLLDNTLLKTISGKKGIFNTMKKEADSEKEKREGKFNEYKTKLDVSNKELAASQVNVNDAKAALDSATAAVTATNTAAAPAKDAKAA